MHYYSFNIGDYAKHTRHLTNDEDLAYRRILDIYYDTERPIPSDIPLLSRRLSLGIEVIETILNEFFHLTDDGWRNLRADAEIQDYYAFREKQSRNGKLGGRPKKTQALPTDNPPQSQKKPNQQPETNNQKPQSASPVGFAEFWSAYPKKVGKGAAENSWKKLKPPLADVLKAVQVQSSTDQWKKDGGQFIPNPATWLNQRRWEDVVAVNGSAQNPIFAGAI